ncbi:Sperm motility kinase 2b, partial [Globisporangium splendens]
MPTDTGATAVRVEIANLRDNERLSFPLVLVEGCVTSVGASSPSVHFIQARLAQRATESGENNSLSWPVVPETGHFKAFVMLPRPGKFSIQLHVHDTLVHVLKIRYALPQTKHRARFHYEQVVNATRGFDAPAGVDNSDAAALKRVQFAALLTQTCIAELYHKQGLGRATIALEFDDSPDCQMPKTGVLETAGGDDDPIYQISDALDVQDAVAREEDIDLKHFVIVGSTHYDPETRSTPGHTAHSYRNIVAFSSVTLHTYPSGLNELTKCCLDNTVINEAEFADDSCGRGTLWSNFATGLGVLTNLFLRATPAFYGQYDGMFGRGFDNINRLLSVYEPDLSLSEPAIVSNPTSEEASSASPTELNYSVLDPVGTDLQGAYVPETCLLSLREIFPFITSLCNESLTAKAAAGAA